MLSEQEAPTSGEIKLGHNALVDFFAQDQYKVLDPNAEMLDDIAGASPKVPVVELRSLLGCFMFSGDDVFKKLGVLSGGERNRYALARILVSPSNFLLLDEPTNHLDMRAKDVLLEAIAAFSGTVIFVSHDRYFIDRLATRVLEVENGAVITYEGNYEDYLRKKEELAGGAIPQLSVPHRSDSVILPRAGDHEGPLHEQNGSGRAPTEIAAKDRPKRLNPIRQKQMEDRCGFLEEEIPRIEAAIAHTEQQLGVYVSAEETQRLTNLAEELRSQLNALTAEWEELMLQLDGA
jgi:ATP-binding cassette subfamily F protein 3